jgi:hypothetical protein
MKNIIQINDKIRLNLLDRCFNLGLPASSKDDIKTLKMYLDVDSKLEIKIINFPQEKEMKSKEGLKSMVLKMSRFYN